MLSYSRHRVTNAMSEGINSVVQTIKRTALGFRNQKHFKAPFFRCDGLDLYPEFRPTRMSRSRHQIGRTGGARPAAAARSLHN